MYLAGHQPRAHDERTQPRCYTIFDPAAPPTCAVTPRAPQELQVPAHSAQHEAPEPDGDNDKADLQRWAAARLAKPPKSAYNLATTTASQQASTINRGVLDCHASEVPLATVGRSSIDKERDHRSHAVHMSSSRRQLKLQIQLAHAQGCHCHMEFGCRGGRVCIAERYPFSLGQGAAASAICLASRQFDEQVIEGGQGRRVALQLRFSADWGTRCGFRRRRSGRNA